MDGIVKIVRLKPGVIERWDHEGEASVVKLEAEISSFVGAIPNGSPTFVYQRPDGQEYPKIAEIDGEVAYTIMEAQDAEVAGTAQIVLKWMDGERVAKSEVYTGRIKKSINGAGTPPVPEPTWADRVIAKATQVLTALPGAVEDALAQAKASGEFDGEDGVSPEITVETIAGGHRVTITDATHTVTFDVLDGLPGADGVSPLVTVAPITGGHRITITDAQGAHPVDVMDGKDGEDGADGVSPTISVAEITGGHRLTITDATGSRTVDVLDGEKGDDGVGITDTVLNADYTLTITYSDGTTYTTPSIRGAQGPQGEPGEDAVVDATLTQPGQAADAAVVGQKFTAQSSEIAELTGLGLTVVDGKINITYEEAEA